MGGLVESQDCHHGPGVIRPPSCPQVVYGFHIGNRKEALLPFPTREVSVKI